MKARGQFLWMVLRQSRMLCQLILQQSLERHHFPVWGNGMKPLENLSQVRLGTPGNRTLRLCSGNS